MSERSEKLFFEGRLRKYEKKIIDYYMERARISGQSETLASIIGYLSVYEGLTQAQLKKLTGFSKSTISTGLSNLINVRYVKKNKIPGKREYKYYLSLNSQDSIDDALGSVDPEIKFFRNKLQELEDNLTEKRGYDLLKGRLEEIVKVFELYQNSLKELKNPNEMVKINYEIPKKEILTVRDINYVLEDFDPEVKQFENDIIDFFKYQSAYSTLTEFMLIIFVYFITRKVLTQANLKNLTGLSVGKISQVVNNLIKKGHINALDKKKYKELIPKELEHQKIYAMISITNSFFHSGIISLKEMLKWEPIFASIKSDLNHRKDELEMLYGYQKIKKKMNEFVDLMHIYKNAIQLFSRLLE